MHLNIVTYVALLITETVPSLILDLGYNYWTVPSLILGLGYNYRTVPSLILGLGYNYIIIYLAGGILEH